MAQKSKAQFSSKTPDAPELPPYCIYSPIRYLKPDVKPHLDWKFLSKNVQLLTAEASKRGVTANFSLVAAYYEEVSRINKEINVLNREKNQSVPSFTGAGDKAAMIEKGKELRHKIEKLEAELRLVSLVVMFEVNE